MSARYKFGKHLFFKNHKIRIDNSPIGYVLDGSRLDHEPTVNTGAAEEDGNLVIFDVYLTMGIGLLCSVFNMCMCYKWSGPGRLEPEPPFGDKAKYET